MYHGKTPTDAKYIAREREIHEWHTAQAEAYWKQEDACWKAQGEGRTAYRQGESLDTNPYRVGTTECVRWRLGWLDEEQEQYAIDSDSDGDYEPDMQRW